MINPMAQNNQQNTLATELEQLIRKASDANTQILQEAGKFMQQVLTQKIEIKDLGTMNKNIVSGALNELVRLNIQHTTNLIDWGVKMSKEFATQFTSGARPAQQRFPNSTQQQTATVEEKPAFELTMQGNIGGSAKTAFLLHSDKPGIVNGYFVLSPFVDPVSGKVLHASTIINPKEFEISNEEALRVDAEVIIPGDAVEGIYRSTVQVIGFDHTEFFLVLTVSGKATTGSIEVKAVQRKTQPKKPLPKKSARKK
jgi:hypothetical protein